MTGITKLDEEQMKELSFLKGIIDSLPVIFYINELEYPGDPRSCQTTMLNQKGLDFIGNTQKEIMQMGYDLFKQIVHPVDLAALGESLAIRYPQGSKLTSVSTLRIKPVGQPAYSLFHCSKVVKETFWDDSVKIMVIVAFEMIGTEQPDQQLESALKEISRLRYEQIINTFTKREKEVLHLIAQGISSKNIGVALFICTETVKRHRNSLIHKAGVKNSAELVALAFKSGEY